MPKYFFTVLLLVIPNFVSAATIFLTATPATVGVGDSFLVTISVDSDISVNAYDGTLIYSPNLVPLNISDGNSIISAWIEHPIARDNIHFAGITPGGFEGSGGKLFSVVFSAQAAGEARVSMQDVDVLESDGRGTKDVVLSNPLSLTIAQSHAEAFVENPDSDPPEPFKIDSESDPTLFGGKTYIVFNTVDKSSGIDHYEVAETKILLPFFLLHWNRVESPYVLHDQSRMSVVYVRAIDRAGNVRVATLKPVLPADSYKFLMLALALMMVGPLIARRFL